MIFIDKEVLIISYLVVTTNIKNSHIHNKGLCLTNLAHICVIFSLLLNLSKYLAAGVLLLVFDIVHTLLYQRFAITCGRLVRGRYAYTPAKNVISFSCISFRYNNKLHLQKQSPEVFCERMFS